MTAVLEREVLQEIKRGDIYWANLRTAYIGESIQTGNRPIVVVSNDLNNKYCTTLNVLPVTSKLDKKPLPVHVEITEECGLGKPSIVLAEQISTIPKSCLGLKIGECTYESYNKIERAMQIQKGISEPFDIYRIKRLILSIIESNRIGESGKFLKSTLVDEFKWYCNSYGYDYKYIFDKYKNSSLTQKPVQRLKVISC